MSQNIVFEVVKTFHCVSQQSIVIVTKKVFTHSLERK